MGVEGEWMCTKAALVKRLIDWRCTNFAEVVGFCRVQILRDSKGVGGGVLGLYGAAVSITKFLDHGWGGLWENIVDISRRAHDQYIWDVFRIRVQLRVSKWKTIPTNSLGSAVWCIQNSSECDQINVQICRRTWTYPTTTTALHKMAGSGGVLHITYGLSLIDIGFWSHEQKHLQDNRCCSCRFTQEHVRAKDS